MRVFGIDGGIASIGWAVLDVEGSESAVLAAGTWMFDAPETAEKRTPTSAERRLKRGQRRVIRRRHQRMAGIRRLLAAHALLSNSTRDSLALGLDPWKLRARALDHPLTAPEFSVVLGHIAKHRGFRSNSKRDVGGNAADETSKMKAAVEATHARLDQWRTVGQMFATDPAFADRKRNRGGGFSRSILRADQEYEVRTIFQEQRRLGNLDATEELEAEFAELAFSQRPLQDADVLVGPCPFIKPQRRAARRSPSFELFRLYSRLAALRITARGGGERKLTQDEIALAAKDFGKQKQLTYHWLRTRLELEDAAGFADTTREEEKKRDFVARAGAAAEGTATLRAVLGEAELAVAAGDAGGTGRSRGDAEFPRRLAVDPGRDRGSAD
jgi:CRISPR-associated endonuclease Csn1